MQMDLIYHSSTAKKKPKADCGPTTEQDEARLADRGGQGGGKGLLLGSQVYQVTLGDVMTEASRMAVSHLGTLNQV